MKQRAVTELQIKQVLESPEKIIKSFDGTYEAIGNLQNRHIRIKYKIQEKYIKIITVM
jgi:hypothetical protein